MRYQENSRCDGSQKGLNKTPGFLLTGQEKKKKTLYCKDSVMSIVWRESQET